MGRLAASEVSRISLAVALTTLLYFLWMDLILYNRIQSILPLAPLQRHPDPQASNLTIVQQSASPTESGGSLHIFQGLSIKLMMMDHVNHYVANPISHSILNGLSMKTHLLWITPNLLSFLGVALCLLAGRLVSWEGRGWQLAAVALMFCRHLMDSMDGMLARERRGLRQHLSLHNSSGFVVDGVADTLGYTCFIVGCFVYHKRAVLKQYQPLLVLYQGEDKAKCRKRSDASSSSNSSRPASPLSSGPGQKWTSCRVFAVFVCLGVQLLAAGALWDRYCLAYHQLLEKPRDSQPQAIVQNEVMKSTLMWLVIWLWRVSNSHALANWLLLSICFNKAWDFLLFIRFIGMAELFMLFLLTEIHYRDVTAYVNMIS